MGQPETTGEQARRSVSLPLSEWITQPVFRGWNPRNTSLMESGLLDFNTGVTAADMVTSGIAAIDMCAYADMFVPDAGPREQVTDRDDTHASFLFARLYAMHQHLPTLGLRDALGYAFLGHQAQTRGGDAPVLALISDWDAIGHAADGWLLTSAGIMPDEASTHPLPDQQTLSAMVALRPLVLPHE